MGGVGDIQSHKIKALKNLIEIIIICRIDIFILSFHAKWNFFQEMSVENQLQEVSKGSPSLNFKEANLEGGSGA